MPTAQDPIVVGAALPRVTRPSPWTPLRHRVFLALWTAQIASNIGSFMQNVGAAWVMGDLRSDPVYVALVQTAVTLPVFLMGLPAGALADIVDRRRLLIATQTAMLVAAASLAILQFLDATTPLSLLGLTFLLGCGGALNLPAYQAIQPELVPRDEFSQAVALGSVTFNLGRFGWSPTVQLVAGYEYNFGNNRFNVPPSPVGADWSQLANFSDVKIEQNRVTAGADWQPTENTTLYLRYIYFDFDDIASGYQSGTTHMGLAGGGVVF